MHKTRARVHSQTITNVDGIFMFAMAVVGAVYVYTIAVASLCSPFVVRLLFFAGL